MANQDDREASDPGAPSADIPDLRKKEKERRRGGLAWWGGRGAAGSFQGGGAAGAVARAAAGASGSVVGRAAGAPVLSRFLAGLTATFLGKAAVALAALLAASGAGWLGYSLLKGGPALQTGLGGPSLGALSSTVRVRAGGRDRLGVAGGGELRFDPVEAPAPAAPPPQDQSAPEQAAEPEPPQAAQGAQESRDRLQHDLSGAKLTASLGGQFGGKNIFGGAGSGRAPRFGGALSKLFPGKAGKLGAMKSGASRSNAASRSVSRVRTSRAIGQLKMARGMSALGAQASAVEDAAASAAGAFDQNTSRGGVIGATGLGTTPRPLGTEPAPSAHDVSVLPGVTAADTAIQSALAGIQSMADQARKMKETGTMLIIAGLALAALGYFMIGTWWGAGVGWSLVAAGLAMAMSGYSMMQKSSDMAERAKEMGRQLAVRTGDAQSKIINECTDRTLNDGTPMANCQSSVSRQLEIDVEPQTRSDLERQKKIPDNQPVVLP